MYGTASFWNFDVCLLLIVISGKSIFTLTAKSPVRSCGFSLTDNILCMTTDKAMGQPCFVQFYDLRDKEQVRVFLFHSSSCLGAKCKSTPYLITSIANLYSKFLSKYYAKFQNGKLYNLTSITLRSNPQTVLALILKSPNISCVSGL